MAPVSSLCAEHSSEVAHKDAQQEGASILFLIVAQVQD